MRAIWPTIGLLTLGTVAIKAAGPVAFGGRALPARMVVVIRLLAPALLAALVAVDTFGGAPHQLVLNARVAGLLAAGGALALRAPIIVVVIAAAASTAIVRAL